ncbi:hypothetical protein NQ317_007114 [Molorchus minor]|uniref:Cyclin N-terminal domain-containing protein n=1 Tax=Molorchus minor TaxID=1323400 RepID=A0ABQ9JZ61_9CUCU|nr:hypothetical protein NQ317_007114 [Molorchus minor]
MKLIAFSLEEALASEQALRPNLLCIQQELLPWEVTITLRDRAVNLLRFLKIWFDVPHTVFYNAATYLDLFLSRIRVKPRYLNCLTLACFFCAAEKADIPIDVTQLVTVSQHNCSIQDMIRMTELVKNKLYLRSNFNSPMTTCEDFLNLFLKILDYVSTRWEGKLHSSELLNPAKLLTRLEVLITSSSCAFFSSSTLVLALLKLELEKYLSQALFTRSMYFVGQLIQFLSVIFELQTRCNIKTEDFAQCLENAFYVMEEYDTQNRKKVKNLTGHNTTHVDKGNSRYHQTLDTIEEKHQKRL